MASTTILDGTGTNTTDIAGRLSQMGNRTSLMVIDATLAALPQPGSHAPFLPLTGPVDGDAAGYAAAAAEIRTLSRRMMQAARDFQATIEPEPGE